MFGHVEQPNRGLLPIYSNKFDIHRPRRHLPVCLHRCLRFVPSKVLHSQYIASHYFTDGSFQLETEGLAVREGEVVGRVVMSKSILVRSNKNCVYLGATHVVHFHSSPAYQHLLRQRPLAQIIGLTLLLTGCLV